MNALPNEPGEPTRVDHGILRELHLRAGIVVLRIAELVAGGDGHDGVRVLEAGQTARRYR